MSSYLHHINAFEKLGKCTLYTNVATADVLTPDLMFWAKFLMSDVLDHKSDVDIFCL